jgi:folate-binding protein YgfZ
VIADSPATSAPIDPAADHLAASGGAGHADPSAPPTGPSIVEAPAAQIAEASAAQQPVREGCGLVDRSERGKLAVTGDEGADFLNGLLSNDILAVEAGSGCAAALLDHKGKMLAELRVIRSPPPSEELWLDCERACLQALFDGLRRHAIGYAAELHKRTLQQGLISLAGPRSGEIMAAATGAPGPEGDEGAGEHANRWIEIGGEAVLLIATDVGLDLVCDAGATERVRSALLGAGAEPVEEAALECLRVERGRPRYGIDIDASTIPQEAGLNARVVSFEKGCYVGQETVARLHYRGRPNRHLRGLRLSAPKPTGAELRLGERVVGQLGTVAVSPLFGPIALALVRREAEPGDDLAVAGGDATARVVELPFA